MLGAIIGDIVGSRFEFNPTNDYNFELFSPQFQNFYLQKCKNTCVFKKIVVPLQRITDEICENKQFSSVENKGSTMINRESYLSQLIKLRDQDLIKVQHGKKYMIIS